MANRTGGSNDLSSAVGDKEAVDVAGVLVVEPTRIGLTFRNLVNLGYQQCRATITPTLDGDVLAVLARHDVTFTTGQLHRLLVQFSEEGIRKVLQRLTRQGIVHSERVGNAYAYRFNRDHLAAEHIIKLADIMSTFLARLTEELEAWEVPPAYAAVFGSAARRSMTADSDLDLLLVRPDDAPEDVWAGQVDRLVEDVTRWTGNDTRTLQFTELA